MRPVWPRPSSANEPFISATPRGAQTSGGLVLVDSKQRPLQSVIDPNIRATVVHDADPSMANIGRDIEFKSWKKRFIKLDISTVIDPKNVDRGTQVRARLKRYILHSPVRRHKGALMTTSFK